MPEYKVIPFAQLLEPPMPVRFSMDDAKMAELCDSIRAHGVLQNLVVVRAKPQEGDGAGIPVGLGLGQTQAAPPLYEIVAGHRRYKAAQILSLKELPCLIFEDVSIAKEAAMLDENLCREDITAAEEATLYAEIIEKYDCTEERLFEIVKRPASYVYARLDLLRGNKDVLQAVSDRKINLSVAQQLNRVDDAQHCRYLLNLCIEGGATARTVMGWVQDYKANGPGQVVQLQPLVHAGKAQAEAQGGPTCFLCLSNRYPANIVWVPMHDFERDQLVERIQGAANAPDLSQASEVKT